MKNSYLRIGTSLACVSMMFFSAIEVQANQSLTLKSNPNLKNLKQSVKPVRSFHGETPWGIWNLPSASEETQEIKTRGAVTEPTVTFEGLGSFDFLEGPDGDTWFYYAEYESEMIEWSEWYVEEYITGYKFTIFDSKFKQIGTIKDKVTLAEGETKLAHAVLDPALSRFFFNDDNNVEAMVYLAVNTGPDFGYEVHYYNKVYSIGGQKDNNGNDVCLGVMPGRCVDTFNAGSGSENFFFSFADDIYPDPSDYDFDDYIQYINDAKTVVSIYGKGSKGTPELVYEKDVYLSRYPGDTTDGIYLITKSENGSPYFVFSQYEKPYFIDPTGFATDERATPDNNLVIETYSYDNGKMNLLSTTKIPVEIPTVEGKIAYTFYSIGSVAWKDDIDTKVNGSFNAPAYIVAKDYTLASNLEEVESSYVIYGNDGKQLRILMQNADGISLLNSANSNQPHAMFVILENDKYTFSFVDLYSGEKLFSLDQANNGDPLTAVCQRVVGLDGNYHYVFEMEYDGLDASGNDIKRIAWYNRDGKLERIDKLNMGKDVMFASVNMYPEALSPTVFDDDADMEYAILVKRAFGNTTRNEFIVVDINGDWYAHFTEDDGKGLPMLFSILVGSDHNRLEMVYNDNYSYNIDIYDLPFMGSTGIDRLDSEYGNGTSIVFDGTNVKSEGCSIEVYNISGMKAASGNNKVSLESLSRGIYMIVAKDTNGYVHSRKITF